VVLFVFDGLRRIYLTARNGGKPRRTALAPVLAWQTRPVEADESLAALSAGEVAGGARKTAAGEHRPELFEPARPAVAAPTTTDAPTAAPCEARRKRPRPARRRPNGQW
jgi:hypothetical protein